jgi:hypothetical protein
LVIEQVSGITVMASRAGTPSEKSLNWMSLKTPVME